MAPELDKFREKYPGYDDLGDAELAGMLAKKYPDAYGYLPEKVSAQRQPETSDVIPVQDPPMRQTTPGLDIPSITDSILNQYNAGTLTDRKVKILEQLKKRGAFDAPEFNVKGLKEHAAYTSETISNVPGSVYGVGKDIYEAVTHPIETAKGAGRIALGASQKVAQAAMPGEQDFQYEKYMDALVDNMDRKYGGLDRVAETFKSDPARVFGDIAAALSGAGTMAKGTRLGQSLKSAGGALEPLTPIAKGVKKVGEKMPQYLAFSKTPSKMYQSAVKFSIRKDFTDAKRNKLTNIALEEGIMPTTEGIHKLWGKIDELNTDIAKRIDEATETGATIKIDDLFEDFKTIEADATLSGQGMEMLKTTKKIKNEIVESNKKIHRTGMSLKPDEAQTMKQNIYKQIKESYESRSPDSLSEKALKSVAKANKRFIETIIPGIKEMNKKDGDYIALMTELENPVKRISNRDWIGFGMTAKIAAGTAIGSKFGMPTTGAIVGGLVAAMDHPRIKARLAIILDKMEKQGIDPGPDARAFMTVLEESREIPRGEEE